MCWAYMHWWGGDRYIYLVNMCRNILLVMGSCMCIYVCVCVYVCMCMYMCVCICLRTRMDGARFSTSVQTGPGAKPASYTMSTAYFPGVKRPGCGADHPPPSSAVVKKEESYSFTPPMGRTAFTETKCLYKCALYHFIRL